MNGLLYLQQYTNLNKESPLWNIGLLSNPIQDPASPDIPLAQLIARGDSNEEWFQIAPSLKEDLALLSNSGEVETPQIGSGSDSELSFEQVPETNPSTAGLSPLESAAASIRAAQQRAKGKKKRRPKK